MAKWKCEICGSKFENFHAQGFDNKIYCPLCYFKRKNQELKKQLEDTNEELELVRCDLNNRTSERDGRERELDKCLSQQKEFINFLEAMISMYQDEYKDTDAAEHYKCVLKKYREIIGCDK